MVMGSVGVSMAIFGEQAPNKKMQANKATLSLVLTPLTQVVFDMGFSLCAKPTFSFHSAAGALFLDEN